MSLVQALIAVLFGYAGFHLTIHPAESIKAKCMWEVFFIVLAIIAMSTTITQGTRNDTSQKGASEKINGLTTAVERAGNAARKAQAAATGAQDETIGARFEATSRDARNQKDKDELLGEIRAARMSLVPFLKLA